MKNFRHRGIKLVEQLPPFPVAIRFPKANNMVLQTTPSYEKQITTLPFQAGTNFQSQKTLGRGNQGKGLLQTLFIFTSPVRSHFKQGVLEDQFAAQIDWPVFFQSAVNISIPLSVSGCLARARKTAGGAVTTSAPIRAHSRIWFGVRIEAPRICVVKS